MGRGLVGNPPARPSSPDAQDRNGQIDPSVLITHKIGLEDGPDAYKTFQEKADGCIKLVINP
jgi:threonine dehydrogenase-like Zn-dependent dehydrogenase